MSIDKQAMFRLGLIEGGELPRVQVMPWSGLTSPPERGVPHRGLHDEFRGRDGQYLSGSHPVYVFHRQDLTEVEANSKVQADRDAATLAHQGLALRLGLTASNKGTAVAALDRLKRVQESIETGWSGWPEARQRDALDSLRAGLASMEATLIRLTEDDTDALLVSSPEIGEGEAISLQEWERFLVARDRLEWMVSALRVVGQTADLDPRIDALDLRSQIAVMSGLTPEWPVTPWFKWLAEKMPNAWWATYAGVSDHG